MIDLQQIGVALEANALDAVLLTSPENLVYLSGVPLVDEESRKWSGLRSAALIKRTGDIAFVLPTSSEHQVRRDSSLQGLRVYPWRPGQNPGAHIAALLMEWDIAAGRIGVEWDHLPLSLYRQLRDSMPGLRFVDCSSLMDRARAVKSKSEIDLLRKAVQATERALIRAFGAAQAGDSERRLARYIADNLYREGADAISHLWVYAGDQTTDKFRPPGDKRLSAGDLLRVDVGASFGAYKSDVARMAIVGEPSPAQRRTYGALREAERQMIDAARPGTPAGKLIEIFGDVCQQHGLYFSGSGLLVHSIGVLTHDFPVVYDASDSILIEEGMVLAIEPYVVVGNEKYAIEDDVLITADGAELLSHLMDTDVMSVIRLER
jgi:Xaa-Pro dipeptidase